MLGLGKCLYGGMSLEQSCCNYYCLNLKAASRVDIDSITGGYILGLDQLRRSEGVLAKQLRLKVAKAIEQT